ncbi:diacylglycerol kinase family protein [Sphingomonas sp. CARO-RG-8B-R24-01]|uniref:diacylglycerol/lipid kinase family protein n=1 Tax=Sphingomonas sp. CARO-RG-8B-R24-01 TaxID=2914831 RepID=UPI001F5602AB|nr:diacylglycerol kinase family protein [Sphingomonas sp. CARO-RG-8B-R24-01]
MKTLWFITNPKSGTATAAKAKALEAICDARGLTLVGRTAFPEDALPTPQALDAAGVDTAVLFAGDGTINAAVTALLEWKGAILILPGGTMNLLAKLLHGSADPAKIIAAAHARARRTRLSFVQVGDHRAYVGLILGPAANWVRAREIVRSGSLRGLARALRHAWSRTFGKGIRLDGVPGLKAGAQAVLVRADGAQLDVAAIDARDFRGITRLGWEWLTGDWVAASEVTQCQTTSFRTRGSKPALALFDGEPVMLEPGSEVRLGKTRDLFLATLDG